MKTANTTRAADPIKKVLFAFALFVLLISAAGILEAQYQTTIHDAFAQIGVRVTGFGGMFVDEEKDTLYVYLAAGQPADVAELDNAITEVLGSSRPAQHRLVVLPGQYTFLELKNWNDQLRQAVLPMPGVVLTGIDDGKNRLKVGVETTATASAVEDELAALGIPSEAVNLVQMEPLEAEAGSLTGRTRPLVGGLNIQRSKTAGNSQCSLGLVAIRQGVAGFVTASHCANKAFQLSTPATVFFQPLKTFPDTTSIGQETVNPSGSKELECGMGSTEIKCPGDRPCRCSDSLFAKVNNNGLADKLGYIATKLNWDGDQNNPPTFKITAKSSAFVKGASITKVGAETGRTDGKILEVCTDDKFTFEGVKVYLLCVNEADYRSDGGDSGSPVFVITNQGKSEVTVTGIHSGFVRIDGVKTAVYSLIDQIQFGQGELGPLLVCADESC